MNNYMPLTSNDSATPTLFIDTAAPMEILLDAATYRLRAVTQVLENLALRNEISSDAVVLSDFALLCSIPLRDGCDLLDAVGRRMDTPSP
ncbi:short-chain dehydrogenase [Pseudomonas fluorescens]|uniref:short-chain dehydrogenase n=1 Tax=Pseudomonas TaxID=286 RepID=UPI000DD4947F|nr:MULTISPECIES: short-chain dehydrogenase [Pseudomonas]KAE9658036.1 short-chain dehydrogenase [Pseudomonas sp. PB105]MBD8193386.1 short-chain dehydrogenase [Pseudomonas fluorescens]MBD8228526.1 short-chain dehydrogenase [Pseudomonas fluorescens]MBD8786497.1 short-chain dehydrogenase [Pseudomonas fluorescens]MBD8818403.1 short-chain dehydrogenase [Pseudomonas fluorescens]